MKEKKIRHNILRKIGVRRVTVQVEGDLRLGREKNEQELTKN